ncbi:MAG: aminotransferase class I/II-fold pyridoxal phosphate-dependent enzyme [Acidobacteriales bacterium]|nr:aminotransferase class I/II-fold pyridoxal phosphate-dependent enzyme [Terriglobales bacterium]
MKKPNRHARRDDATHCVHAGEERHGRNAPLTTEIAQTSVFVLPDVEEMRRFAEGKSEAYFYTRYGNPTIRAAEEKLAALEGGEECVVTASGMGAILAVVLGLCSAGDEIVSMLDIYGGTLKLFEQVLPRFGIRVRLVPFHELAHVERHFTRQTRLLFLEAPTNPTLRCADLEGLAEAAHRRKIRVVVDNTFATPILQKPLALGAHLVIHSATKYLGGHSDVTAGAVVGRKDLVAQVRGAMILSGTSLDPFAAYLMLRGMKTLQLRVERACANAARISAMLSSHPKVSRVMYPGLEGCDGHSFARRQMRDFGMMVSFEAKGGGRAAERFINALKLWYLAPSLGGVESTVSYPVLSSHAGMPAKRLKLLDVSAATVRLSAGIEEAADLIQDLQQALEHA